MNISVPNPSQLALLVLTSALFFTPISAVALTSNGTDGIFQPSTSMSTSTTGQQIFNYTDIYIPSGVTIDIAVPTASLPFIWLATGNVDIAGVINIGTGNSLWIETPNSIYLSGSLNLLDGSSIALVSNAMTLSGGTLPSELVLTGGGNISVGGNVSGGDIPVDLILTRGNISGGNILILSPVPEPEVWTMLFLGLFALFFVSRIRNHNDLV